MAGKPRKLNPQERLKAEQLDNDIRLLMSKHGIKQAALVFETFSTMKTGQMMLLGDIGGEILPTMMKHYIQCVSDSQSIKHPKLFEGHKGLGKNHLGKAA